MFMAGPRTNLEQWYCFLAVVDEGSGGGIAQKSVSRDLYHSKDGRTAWCKGVRNPG